MEHKGLEEGRELHDNPVISEIPEITVNDSLLPVNIRKKEYL
jgi:hypothetical protein